MGKQKKTSGSLALNSTPQVITIPPSNPVRARKLRVAAYARVSSSSEDQLNSFAAQNAHYTELITANPEWEFVDVYADKGITGTSVEKREDFQRLLADCRRGRIDKVLVKSSSRFARNTKECLEAAQLDGAGAFQAYRYIVRPNLTSVIAALAVLLFADNWNIVDQAVVFLKNTFDNPLSVYLGTVVSGDPGMFFAVSVFYLIPALLVFFLGQDYLAEGIALSGVKA